ncbi:hypothetical protein NDU88_000678, partial [Pleurodeles waltl]
MGLLNIICQYHVHERSPQPLLPWNEVSISDSAGTRKLGQRQDDVQHRYQRWWRCPLVVIPLIICL